MLNKPTIVAIDFLSELGLEQGEEEPDSYDSEVETLFGIINMIRYLLYGLLEFHFSLLVLLWEPQYAAGPDAKLSHSGSSWD